MQEEPLLSIIVPVYGVEKYISQCFVYSRRVATLSR